MKTLIAVLVAIAFLPFLFMESVGKALLCPPKLQKALAAQSIRK